MNELQKLMNQITDLGNQIRIATAAFAAHATDTSVSIADLEKEQAALNEMNKRLATMQAAYAAMTQAAAATVQPTGGPAPTGGSGPAGSEGQSRTLKDMPAMEEAVALLNEQDFRKDIKIMVGGAPITQAFADKIGADAYTEDAASAAMMAKKLVD